MAINKPMPSVAPNKIIYLDTEELADPLLVITSFFDVCALPRHLKKLKKWRNNAAFEVSTEQRVCPVDLLELHELIMRLLETAWVLKERKSVKLNNFKQIQPDLLTSVLKQEKKKLEHYPKNLKYKEIINPLCVLRKIFKDNSLDDYRRILKTWLQDAINDLFMEENLFKYEVIIIYENLVKLCEACWLIHERNTRQSPPELNESISGKSPSLNFKASTR